MHRLRVYLRKWALE